jgi:hypothetical protein
MNSKYSYKQRWGPLRGKVFHVYGRKAYRGIRGLAPLNFNLGTKWSSVVNLTLQPLSLGKNPGTHCAGGRWRPEPIVTLWRVIKITIPCAGRNKNPGALYVMLIK